MKWNKEQEQQLKALCFEEKSNKEIAQIMNIELADVHNGRSRFGVTIDKVKVTKGVQAKLQKDMQKDIKVKRTAEEINTEIMKVEKAKDEAVKKVDRCKNRLEVLYGELVDAHNCNN